MTRRSLWLRTAARLGVLPFLLFVSSPLAACSVCFGDPEQSGPVQSAILLLLALVVSVQLVVARLLWRLMRRGGRQ